MSTTTTSSNYSSENSIMSRIIKVVSAIFDRYETEHEAAYYENEAYEKQKVEKMARDHIRKVKASIWL